MGDIRPLPALVRSVLSPHPEVRAVRLVGSRERGEEGPLSDWDFSIDADDPGAVAAALPRLVEDHLDPLAAQWDRLAHTSCFMLVLPGPTKVDLLLDLAHAPESPWHVDASTLTAIDEHFWDWLLWIAAKDLKHRDELVRGELVKMSRHLLHPMGVTRIPANVESACSRYRRARTKHETQLGLAIGRRLEREVVRGLRRHRYDI